MFLFLCLNYFINSKGIIVSIERVWCFRDVDNVCMRIYYDMCFMFWNKGFLFVGYNNKNMFVLLLKIRGSSYLILRKYKIKIIVVNIG